MEGKGPLVEIPPSETVARFIEPMLLEATSALPEGPNWSYEVKLAGYRALAIKSAGKVRLRSRNDKDFNARYPALVSALAPLPDETVLDGEIVALDAEGRPSFHALQNHGAAHVLIVYYIFEAYCSRQPECLIPTLRCN